MAEGERKVVGIGTRPGRDFGCGEIEFERWGVSETAAFASHGLGNIESNEGPKCHVRQGFGSHWIFSRSAAMSGFIFFV